jgi:hypothetical protein
VDVSLVSEDQIFGRQDLPHYVPLWSRSVFEEVQCEDSILVDAAILRSDNGWEGTRQSHSGSVAGRWFACAAEEKLAVDGSIIQRISAGRRRALQCSTRRTSGHAKNDRLSCGFMTMTSLERPQLVVVTQFTGLWKQRDDFQKFAQLVDQVRRRIDNAVPGRALRRPTIPTPVPE